MGRTLDLSGQPLSDRPHSPRGTTLSVAKKDERVALIFWARTAPANAETSSALSAAKARGVTLGNPRLHVAARALWRP
jgi:hypothetical protein